MASCVGVMVKLIENVVIVRKISDAIKDIVFVLVITVISLSNKIRQSKRCSHLDYLYYF